MDTDVKFNKNEKYKDSSGSLLNIPTNEILTWENAELSFMDNDIFFNKSRKLTCRPYVLRSEIATFTRDNIPNSSNDNENTKKKNNKSSNNLYSLNIISFVSILSLVILLAYVLYKYSKK